MATFGNNEIKHNLSNIYSCDKCQYIIVRKKQLHRSYDLREASHGNIWKR